MIAKPQPARSRPGWGWWTTQKEEAITTRHQIGEAMGILSACHHLTEDQAFDVLRRYSQHTNVKLREAARLVCESGTLPQPGQDSGPGRLPALSTASVPDHGFGSPSTRVRTRGT
ncbi:ANTAR domain-containing protein [Streptomyces sp. NPDC059944]|uniref:ANTAR domain-containing protein n=1 Tax=unclassified Streptomyces TaxID=2593676 RepID=UPI00365CF8FA